MLIDSIENKQKILANFLKIAEFEGFGEHALEQAIASSGIDSKFKNIIFENGCLDLIEFYIDEQNRALSEIINKTAGFQAWKVREKIKFCLYKLFENEEKNRLALARLRNFYFDIKNFKNGKNGPRPLYTAFKHVGKIADQIWILCGDKSTDFNYYTKRLTLSKIILKAFTIFIKDESLEKTKTCIDGEIEKVMQFEKFKLKMRNARKDLQEKSREFFVDEKGNFKSVKQIVKDLPFIRLFN